MSGETVSDKPLLRVVRGNPDDTELAVLTAMFSLHGDLDYRRILVDGCALTH